MGRLVRVRRGGSRGDGVELVFATRLDTRPAVQRRGPRPVRFRGDRSGRGGWGLRSRLVGAVELRAVRLCRRVGSLVLLRHGRLPPPARRDGGRPAVAGPRSAGRRRSMRTVATRIQTAPGPDRNRLGRRVALNGGSTATSRPPRYPRRRDLAGGRGPPPLVAVVGPTATGKSDLGVALAAAAGRRGRQRRRDAALPRAWTSARPSSPPASARGVPHHLLDVLDVTETASVAAYQRAARRGSSSGCAPRAGRRCWSAGPGCTCRRCSTSWSSPAPTRRCAPSWRPSWPTAGPAALHARLAARRPGGGRGACCPATAGGSCARWR